MRGLHSVTKRPRGVIARSSRWHYVLGPRLTHVGGERVAAKADAWSFQAGITVLSGGDGWRMIRLLIVTDVRFYREGLAELLARAPNLRVTATAASADDALARLHQECPEVVLLDTAMPNALGIASQVTSSARGAKVIALALREADDDIIAWAEAGRRATCPGIVRSPS